MKHLYKICLLVVIYLSSFSLAEAYEIRGKLKNVSDSTYVNLSFINNIDDFFELGHDMIIRQVKVADDGSFLIKGSELASGYRFYRLSFAIGENVINYTTGMDRNNLTLYLNNSSVIDIECIMNEFMMSDVKITAENDMCTRLSDIDVTIQSIIDGLFDHKNTTPQKRMIREKAQEFTRSYVDTCKLPIIRYYLYSYHLGYDLEGEDFQLDDIADIMNKNFPNSIYTDDLNKRVRSIASDYTWLFWLVISLLLIYSSLMTVLYLGARKKSKKEEQVLLSFKEKEVLKLIAEGKINKEIAAELSVEINTVKTHITNIYKKLNIKNRAQAADYYSNM